MSIEEIIDKELDEEFADPLKNFKGTKDEWAIWWMEDHMLPGAKELDLIHDECAIRRVLAIVKKATEKFELKPPPPDPEVSKLLAPEDE